MGKLIDREATFRTKNIVDGGLGKTSTGLPQVVLSLRADEIYDFDEKCWVPWDDVEEREITAYLVLIGKKDNEIFHMKTTEKALGWDGASLGSLNDIDYQNSGIQFTTKENEYEGNTTIQVAGIDHYDAEPGRTVQKLDAAEVKGLDAKYAAFFRKRSGEKKPKTVGKPVVPVVKPKATASKRDPEADAADVPETTSLRSVSERASEAPSKKTAKPPKKTAKPKEATKADKCTQTEAWVACKKAAPESVTEQQLADLWLKTVEANAPDGDEDQLSPEGWANIRRIIVAQVKDDLPF